MTLWKKKGGRALLANNRDITLTDCDGKASGALLRKRLLDPVRRITLETQMGSGLHGGSTDTAHLFSTGAFALAMR